MKVCTRCKTLKPLHEFGADKSAKDGRYSQCKVCKCELAKERYQADPEKHRARTRDYQARNPDATKDRYTAWRAKNSEYLQEYRREYRKNNLAKITAAYARWKAENPDKMKAASLNWYRNNLERAQARSRAYFYANRERMSQNAREWNKNNPDRAREQHRAWSRANRHIKSAISTRYRARKLAATPSWADHDAIMKFYESADALGMLLGEWYEVDHIVPLKSDLVCGLHCEFNLQILHHKANASKGNRWWPGMPEREAA